MKKPLCQLWHEKKANFSGSSESGGGAVRKRPTSLERLAVSKR